MDPETFIKQLSEKVNETVNNAWMQDQLKQKFHYPPPELPENIKEYDRVTVRAVLDALTKSGWSIRRD